MAEHPDQIVAPSVECFEGCVCKVVRITFTRLSIVLLIYDALRIDSAFSLESAQLHMPGKDIIERAILKGSLHKFHSTHLFLNPSVILDISHVLIEYRTIVIIIDIYFFSGLYSRTLTYLFQSVAALSLFHYNLFIFLF